jgi:hypothetical protein
MRERLIFILVKDSAAAGDSDILYKVKNFNIIKTEKSYRNIGGNALNEKNIKNYDSC